MFSKSKPGEVPQPSAPPPVPGAAHDWAPSPGQAGGGARDKAAQSVLSSDLTITGNVKSSGEITVEGIVEGDIRASLLTVGESATIKGEIVAEEVVVNGRVVGRLRGLKIRLSASARVEGDIIHKTIAIESGAHFEGSVQRQEDPGGAGRTEQARIAPPRDADIASAAE
ncbi:polymer-forming cytoskeletal protein [soil metagenome]